MSTLVISDLAYLEELDNQESKVAGAASAGAAAAADGSTAVAASGSTNNGGIYARGDGNFIDNHYGYYHRAPFAVVEVYGR